MSVLPVWERMWICRALSLPKTFWHRRHLWRKNGSSLTYWDLSTTATRKQSTLCFFITVCTSHGKIIYCFSSSFFFHPFQCNKIHSKWCLVSRYLLLETITFTNHGRGGAGRRELCPFVTRFFFHLNYIWKASQKYDPVVYSNQERCNLFWHQNESYSEFYFRNDIS